MSEPVLTISPGTSVEEAAVAMRDRGVGSFVLLDDGQPVGIVTLRDLVHDVLAEGRDPARTPVEDVMSKPVVTIEPDAQLDAAIERMAEHGIGHLVVELQGDLRGVVSVRDIAYAEPELARQARDHLRTHWEG